MRSWRYVLLLGVVGTVAFTLATVTGLLSRSSAAAAATSAWLSDDRSANFPVLRYVSDGLFSLTVGCGVALILIALFCDFADFRRTSPAIAQQKVRLPELVNS
jgi:hypothetical protein